MSTSQKEQSSPKRKKYRNVFTVHEDEILEDSIGQYGTCDWDSIAKNLPGRTPRQCRERWFTYLSPDVNRTPWSVEEDSLLYELQQTHGPKWGVIAAFFVHRTQNNVKNRYNTIVRKARTLCLNPGDRGQFLEAGQKITSRSTRPFWPETTQKIIQKEPNIITLTPQQCYSLKMILN